MKNNMDKDKNNPKGPVVGAVIVVVLLIVGGWYIFFAQDRPATPIGELGDEATANEIDAAPDESLDALEIQGTSDEIEDIEADLDATDLEGLDAELEAMEAELLL